MRKVSIIICSDGRRCTLPAAVNSALAQSVGEGVKIEVLVIDNGAGSAQQRLIDIKHEKLIVVKERQVGHSHALNTGISKARGQLLLFLDDDGIADPGWAQAYINADKHGVGYLFGPIYTAWSNMPHELLPRSLGGFSLGDGIIDFPRASQDSYPVGVNMALTRRAIDKGLLFDQCLGPGSRLGLPFGADILIGREAFALGFMGRYVGNARVFHEVPRERISFRSLVKRKYLIGRSAYTYDWKPIGTMKLGMRIVWEAIKAVCSLWGSQVEAKKSILRMTRDIGFLRSKIASRG